MKKFFTKDNLRGVAQSLVASIIFLILLEPAIKIGKNFGKGIINSFIDYFYYSCARVTGIGFLSYLAFLAFVWYVLYMLQQLFSMASSLPKKKKATNTQNADVNTSSKSPEKELVETILKNEKIKKQDSRLEKALRITSRICIFFWILFLCYVFIYQLWPATVNGTFNRRIVQITPYIEASEIDILKSEWVSMESKDDYDQIKVKIDNILSENDLK